jgi:hypothetical protein
VESEILSSFQKAKGKTIINDPVTTAAEAILPFKPLLLINRGQAPKRTPVMTALICNSSMCNTFFKVLTKYSNVMDSTASYIDLVNTFFESYLNKYKI